MKKRLSLFMLAMLTVLGIQAQMIAYSVSTNVVGEPGEPTVIDLQGTTGTNLSNTIFDADGNIEINSAEDLKGFPIGFEFRYNSQKMTHFLIGGDAIIQLSPTEAISTDLHKNRNSMFTTNGIRDAFGIATREGLYGLDDTEISFWLEGTEGTRALVIQFKNVDFQGTYNADNDYCGAKATILYRLYEKTGNIEMKVSGFKPVSTGSNNFMRVGILGDSRDFVLVRAWDGSSYSASDGRIVYSPTSYPQDGTVYTFVAPEPCVAPFAAPSNIVLTSTTTQISGTFDAVTADHYLVLATTEDALSEKPADGAKYAAGDEIGNAKVIAIADRGEFYGLNNMEQGTYNVFIIPFNSLCMDGPLYCAEAGKATIAMKPTAPAALSVTFVDKNNLTLKAEDSGVQMVIAMTDEVEINSSNQVLENGVFGTPTGTYQVGDAIEGGGKVIYVGNTTDAINLSDLTAGKTYYFRAWSADGNGGYSSEYLDLREITVTELPWEFPWMNYGDFTPAGWTFSEESVWSDNQRAEPAYFYNQINAADEAGTDQWAETSWIELGTTGTTVSFGLAGTQRSGWMQSAWTLADGEYVAIQVTTDDQNFTDVLKITNADVESLANGTFTNFSKRFNDFAGERARIRIFIHRTTAGQTQISDFKLSENTYGIVGTIPGLTWDADLLMSFDADNKNIYTASLNVTVDEVPDQAYEYKLRANGNWDGYQLPANGNQYWQPTEAGDYTLVFTADIAANTLSLSAQRPYEVSFANEAYWTNVYAYTWIEDGDGNVIAEPSGAWPGTEVPVSGGFFNRSWTYNFTSEQQPQFIIWNNGGGNPDYEEEAAQTDNLPFVNGKKYSMYPEITSVKISGNWNEWDGPEMTVTEYNDKAYQTTVDLKSTSIDQEFKLVVNGEWIGSGELEGIEGDEAAAVTQGETGSNLTLKAGKAYDIVAFWATPSASVKTGWILEITENTTVGVNNARVNGQANKTIYNVKGQRLNHQQRGVNIVNGQKVFKK